MQNTLKTALKTIQMLEKELKAIANNQSGCQSNTSTETPHVAVLRDVSNSRQSQEVKEKPSRKPLKHKFTDNLINPQEVVPKCDLPRENRPSSHLVMIVEIPVLIFLIGVTSFARVWPTIFGKTGHNSLLVFL